MTDAATLAHGDRTTRPKLQLGAKSTSDRPSASDGKRILIDRVWPPDRSKSQLALSEWYPEWAPSRELEQWFDLRPERWEEYCKRYREELVGRGSVLGELETVGLIAGREPVTLVCTEANSRFNAGAALVRIIHELAV